MRFHLPAYLCADLRGELLTASVNFHLADISSAQFETLNAAQRQAVREFLLLRLSDPMHEFDHKKIAKALPAKAAPAKTAPAKAASPKKTPAKSVKKKGAKGKG